ncbi:hypothetical protein DL96DRAFT_1703665 [Flagelloscypha sp. PMI_526]|nr:hypothetical protein DL96DRAFT_1703665 [Flagelloscypha sp. PMI_526]
MPIFRKFMNPRRVPKWFDDDVSAHQLVCKRCATPGQAIVPVCTTCNTSVFLHLKRKVATTKYDGAATHETLFLQMREAQTQLIRVEQLLDSLQETRRTLKEFIALRRVKVTPPIMTLPREILVTIFDILGTTNNNIAAFESIPAAVP